jgi:hypothetical protein
MGSCIVVPCLPGEVNRGARRGSRTKEKPLEGVPRGAWRQVVQEEESGPAPARVVKPWGQGHLDADPMLQRDSDYS